MRYFLDLSYNGAAFHGWQIQRNANTVQEEVNKALSLIFQEEIACMGSGRTDTGVHAKQQIAHVDLPNLKLPLDQLRYRLNLILPPEISINEVTKVKEDAHARFDASLRTYDYQIVKRKNPFLINQAYLFNKTMNLARVQEALEIIREWKNFQAFSKVHTEVNNFECEIFDIWWKETNEGHTFCVSANRFLRGMVRAMVGTLLEIGTEKLKPSDLIKILKSGDRSNAGRAVPPDGLFLSRVKYPESVYLDS